MKSTEQESTRDQEWLEEKLSDLPEVLKIARELIASLECAETVETRADFAANIREAIADMHRLAPELKALLKGVP